MSRIDPPGDPSRLLADMVRLRARESRVADASTVDDAARKPGSTVPVSEPSGLDEAALARRVQAIDRQDPQRRRKAFRIYLEGVLQAEFGAGLVNDPGFHSLVDQVHDLMASDPALCLSIDRAADLLLDQRPA
jgi:hypothetical protein